MCNCQSIIDFILTTMGEVFIYELFLDMRAIKFIHAYIHGFLHYHYNSIKNYYHHCKVELRT